MTNLLTKKQLTMKSIFAGLPNDIIIQIVQIENRRSEFIAREKLITERKYNEVITHLNKVSTYDEFCPSIRDTFNRGGDGLSCAEIWVFEQDWINDI